MKLSMIELPALMRAFWTGSAAFAEVVEAMTPASFHIPDLGLGILHLMAHKRQDPKAVVAAFAALGGDASVLFRPLRANVVLCSDGMCVVDDVAWEAVGRPERWDRGTCPWDLDPCMLDVAADMGLCPDEHMPLLMERWTRDKLLNRDISLDVWTKFWKRNLTGPRGLQRKLHRFLKQDPDAAVIDAFLDGPAWASYVGVTERLQPVFPETVLLVTLAGVPNASTATLAVTAFLKRSYYRLPNINALVPNARDRTFARLTVETLLVLAWSGAFQDPSFLPPGTALTVDVCPFSVVRHCIVSNADKLRLVEALVVGGYEPFRFPVLELSGNGKPLRNVTVLECLKMSARMRDVPWLNAYDMAIRRPDWTPQTHALFPPAFKREVYDQMCAWKLALKALSSKYGTALSGVLDEWHTHAMPSPYPLSAWID